MLDHIPCRGITSNVSVMSFPSLCRIPHSMGRRPARGPTPLKCRDLDIGCCRRVHCDLCSRFRLRGILFHLGKRELELLKHGMPFRGLSELLVPELFDRELHLLDQLLAGADFGLHVARLASASRRTACAAITIAFSVATSSGRESAVVGTKRLQHTWL